jgi:TRAP-type C4-dicarboxylate transport system substrate-binding protein
VKKPLLAGLCLLLLALIGAPVRGAVPLRLGVGSDDDGLRRAAARAFGARVEAVARGRIHVSVAGPALWGYPGASELELVRAVAAGDPPLALVSGATLSNFSSAMDVLDAPYLFADRRAVVRTLYGPPGRALLDSLASRGLVGMTFVAPVFRVLVTRRPIPAAPSRRASRLLDFAPLEGARMGTVQSASAELFVEALGGEAVPAPLGRLPAMARDGFLDGADLDPSSAAVSGLLEVAPWVLDTRHAVSVSVLIANPRFLEDLGASERLALWDGALAATSAGLGESEPRATGRRWTKLTESERRALVERTASARRLVLQRLDPGILDAIGEP